MTAIAFTPVGNAGNAPDKTGYGAVNSPYAISKYEVTIGQYVAFLNTVAAVPTASYITNLYTKDMNDDDYVIENTITRKGSGTVADPYQYAVATGPADPQKNPGVKGSTPNDPVPFVDWFDAARFINWLNNGANASASTETGTYTLNGATSGFIPRNADAKFWLPTENEWYKAAYFDPALNQGAGGYWLNATRSNRLPDVIDPPGSANAANYNGLRPEQYKLIDVGSYALSPSAFGTFDQAGNLWEWSGTNLNENYIVRGGSWSYGLTTVESIQRRDYKTDYNDDDTGFRVATKISPYVDIGALPTPQLHYSLTGYEQISSLYLGLLNREADGPGYQGWLKALASKPASASLAYWRELADTIGASQEARQTFAALANPQNASNAQIETFINNVYKAYFSRDADVGGLAGWSALFKAKAAAGAGVGSIVVDIIAATNNSAANADHIAVIRNAALGIPEAYPLGNSPIAILGLPGDGALAAFDPLV